MKIKWKTTYSDDEKLCGYIIGYFLIQALNLLIKLFFNFPSWGIVSKAVLALLLLRAFTVIIKRTFKKFLFSEVIVLMLFVITFLIGAYDADVINSIIFDALIVFVPLGICTYSIVNKQVLLDRLYKWSWLIQGILIVIFLLFSDTSAYSMSASNALMFQILIMTDHYLKDKKIYDLLMIILDLMLIVMFGSRGALLCFIAYILFRVLAFDGNRKRIIRVGAGCILGICFLLFYKQIFSFIFEVLEANGMYSRTIKLLLLGQITGGSGRLELYQMYWEKILESPLLGWGVAGGWIEGGSYPHNLFIELLLAFGIPAGASLIIFLIGYSVKGLRSKCEASRRVFLILLSNIMVLMVSSSFVLWPTFYMFIFACFYRKGKSTLHESKN